MRRTTRQREAILKFLENNESHPTADMIYESLRKEIPNLSKGTVYRNLKVLQEEGLVSELDIKGTLSRFERKQANHYHFRCEGCGRVIDIDEPFEKSLNNRIEKMTGLKINSHQLEFRGLCQDCKK